MEQYFVFGGGDEDLLLIPITGAYALLLAGENLASRENILDTLQALLALRDEVERSLRSMGVTAELKEPPPPPANPPVKKKGKTGELLPSAPPSPEMEALLKDAPKRKSNKKRWMISGTRPRNNMPGSPPTLKSSLTRKPAR